MDLPSRASSAMFTRGAGATAESKEQPHELAHAPGETLPSEDAAGDALPITSDEERSVPASRGEIDGGAEGE